MKKSEFSDPFQKVRLDQGHSQVNDQNDPVTMLLRLADVRKCAKNWQTFTSAAQPGRIVVPSEVNIREVRQIPFELDPPLHTKYRDLVEEWFKRPQHPEYEAQLVAIVNTIIEQALTKERFEVVEDFALPLQSKALTLLLNIPQAAADTWIKWGVHVFRSEETALDGDKAAILYDYIDEQIEQAIATPSDDLYTLLLNAEVDGKKLTKEEIKGVMILTFAGGRDTIINYVTNTLAYLAEHPAALERLKNEPKIAGRVVEELVRYFSPLTHIGRVVTEDTHVCEHAIKADSRVSLCWASANRDASVFKEPNKIDLDRKRNPHVAFGFGHHKCLGAHHARQIMKVLLLALANKVRAIEIQDAKENIEEWGQFERKVGFDRLEVRFLGR